MKLFTKRLCLKQVVSTDLDDIHQLHSQPEVDEFNTLGIPKSIDETKDLLNSWLEQQRPDHRLSYIFTIRQIESDQFIGLIAIKTGKINYKSAEVWYKVHPAHWYNGYANEALNEVLRFSFKDLSLHRIEAGCAIGNVASIKLLEKVGMNREGCKRKILPIRGQWIDNYFYAILDTDYLEMM